MNEPVKIYVTRRRAQIAQRIREARSRRGWTQEQTAQFLGCSRITFNRVEQGRAELGIAEIELLAQEFNLPFSFFLQQSNMEEQV